MKRARLGEPRPLSVASFGVWQPFSLPEVKENKGALAIDWDDEVIKGTLVARDGKLLHAALTEDWSEPPWRTKRTRKPRRKAANNAGSKTGNRTARK